MKPRAAILAAALLAAAGCKEDRAQSCNAAKERLEAEDCVVDADCDHPERPNCVAARCSACSAGQSCVPDLDVCAVVVVQNTDAGPFDSGFFETPPPGDAGAIDGSFLHREVDEPPPVERPFTHAGRLDVAQEVLLAAGTESGTITLDVRDISAVPRVGSASVAEGGTIVAGPAGVAPAAVCDIRTYANFRRGPAVDIGDVTLTPFPTAPGLTGGRFRLRFDHVRHRYVLGVESAPSPSDRGHPMGEPDDPLPVGEPLLVFPSTVARGGRRITELSSPGVRGLTKAWPPAINTQERYFDSPYELVLPRATQAALQSGIDLVPPIDAAMVIPFVRIEGAQARSAQVVLRILGRLHQLHCAVAEEPGRVEVSSLILNELAAREGPGTYPLILERTVERRISIDPDAPGVSLHVTLRVRHSYRSTVRIR